MDATDLLEAVMNALRGNAATPEAGDMAVFFAVSSIMAGNWQPLEQVRVPVKTFLEASGRLNTPEARQASVEAAVEEFVQPFSQDDTINLFLGAHAKPGADAIAAVRTVLRTYLGNVIGGFLDYPGTPELPFSTALQGTMIGFSGEWYTRLSECLDSPDSADELAIKAIEFSKAGGLRKFPERAGKIEMAAGCAIQLYTSLKARYLAQQQQQQQ